MHFSISSTNTTKPFEIIYTDLWAPYPYHSPKRSKYYLHFIDDFSRFTWIYPLKTKYETCTVFTCFRVHIER